MFDWLTDLFGEKKEISGARSAFEYARNLEGESREIRAIRIRAALRSRQVLDKIFIEASHSQAEYAEESMIALAGGEKRPEKPEADDAICFQTIKTLNGYRLAWVPRPYAEAMFNLGAKFERGEIDMKNAIEQGQAIANKLADELRCDLYYVQPIEVLGFLRDKLNPPEGEPTSEDEA
ncbi:MAG: hypothetical protein RL247_835 [Actinomycetota bacterium]|jgi:hypothetical protein